MVLGRVEAFIEDSTVNADDVTVTATNAAFVDAHSELSAVGTTDTDAVSFKFILGNGDLAAGAAIAINVIGWESGTSR